MCLTKLKKFTPAKVGYQVKFKFLKDQYCSLYRDSSYQYLGESYEAKEAVIFCSLTDYCSYVTGFHVFHKLSDARLYRDSRMHASRAIVKVKLGGKRSTGVQRFEIMDDALLRAGRGGWRKTIDAKVTVCAKITLLKEVE